MIPREVYDRPYFQTRLREELGRARRHGREFSLLILEAVPAHDGLPIRKKVRVALEVLGAHLRGSDALARVFEDTVAALLVETDEQGAMDALIRIRSRLAATGTWHVTLLNYPRAAEEIERHVLLRVA